MCSHFQKDVLRYKLFPNLSEILLAAMDVSEAFTLVVFSPGVVVWYADNSLDANPGTPWKCYMSVVQRNKLLP